MEQTIQYKKTLAEKYIKDCLTNDSVNDSGNNAANVCNVKNASNKSNGSNDSYKDCDDYDNDILIIDETQKKYQPIQPCILSPPKEEECALIMSVQCLNTAVATVVTTEPGELMKLNPLNMVAKNDADIILDIPTVDSVLAEPCVTPTKTKRTYKKRCQPKKKQKTTQNDAPTANCYNLRTRPSIKYAEHASSSANGTVDAGDDVIVLDNDDDKERKKDEIFLVENILDHVATLDIAGNVVDIKFLVKWAGYSNEQNSWASANDFTSPVPINTYWVNLIKTLKASRHDSQDDFF